MERRQFIFHLVIFFLLLVVSIAIYHPVFSMGFFSDDYHALYVAKHQDSVLKYFTTNIIGTREGSSYGPMWNVLNTFEYNLFGMNPIGYHVVSLLLYIGAAFILYLFTYRLTELRVIGLAAGLLFLALPSHVEAISWMGAQSHPLATFFYITALYCYYRSRYTYALIAALLSLLAKEIGLSFIIGFALIEALRILQSTDVKADVKRAVLRLAPGIVLFIAFLMIREYTTGTWLGYYGNKTLSFNPRGLIGMFVEMTINLFVSYPERIAATAWLMNHLTVFFVGIIAAVAACVWIARQYRRQTLWGFLMYGAAVFPYLNLGYNQLGNEGERYTYLPSLFAAIIVAIFLHGLIERFAQVRKEYWYTLIIAVVILVQYPHIKETLSYWQQADEVMKKSIASVVDLNLSENDYLIFVGLPDHLRGAQLLRNGIREALSLHGYPYFEGERVLQGLVLTPDNTLTSSLTIQPHSTTTLVMTPTIAESRTLTGLPIVETKFGTFTLEGFRKSDHTGERIRVELNAAALDSAKAEGKRIMLVYYTPLGLQSFPL